MRLLAGLLTLLVTQTSAYAGTMKEDFFGCKDKDDMSRIVSLLAGSDREAFKKFATNKVMTGECLILQSGTEVKVEDPLVFSGPVCVRPKGDQDCYHVPSEFVRY